MLQFFFLCLIDLGLLISLHCVEAPLDSNPEVLSIFMPGRLCLFGEHSDWAGGFREKNSDLEKGFAIIAPTNQGLYAVVTREESKFIFTATLNDGSKLGPFEVEMEEESLLKQAKGDVFFSYVAGVALQYLRKYHVKGLRVDNYATDLPIKKGLSSSAAACELVSRAFNKMYHLKLSLNEEMEMSYQGERTTFSQCGRMDHACGFGSNPILIEFDGDRLQISNLVVGKNFYFVIVDLGGVKNTIEILKSLQKCYPVALNSTQKNVQNLFGPMNIDIISNAIDAFQLGDEKKIGTLMKRAQAAFDEYATPLCLVQLRSPLLHKVLLHPTIQPYIEGGKGVGSQGDGAVQLIVKDAACQRKVIDIIEKELHMKCLPLTLYAATLKK